MMSRTVMTATTAMVMATVAMRSLLRYGPALVAQRGGRTVLYLLRSSTGQEFVIGLHGRDAPLVAEDDDLGPARDLAAGDAAGRLAATHAAEREDDLSDS